MLVRLLAQHAIDGVLHEKNAILDVTRVTPLMEPLDEEASVAIASENIRVFARYEGTPHGYPFHGPILDSPPIPRPLDNNQPEWHFVGAKEYVS
jgi:hypothetical protein